MTTCVDLSQVILNFPLQHNGLTYVRKSLPTQITFTILLSVFMFPLFTAYSAPSFVSIIAV